ncbi:MAG: hypothetical protein KGL35_01930 [Bradyrhizobium sp.]|nr:hypothetical protein [Bradyrhizobium sp.]
MHLTTQTPLANTVGAGNNGQFIQVHQNADGTFAALTGTDCFGDTAGTVHFFGSQIDSGGPRAETGQYTCPVSVIEMDPDHLNMLENVAPYNPTLDNPTDTLENGTIIGGTDSVYGDPSKPYFLFALTDKPLPTTGFKVTRFFIGQFMRAGGRDQSKAKQRNKIKYNVVSVDGQGFVTTTLAATMANLGTVAGPTLSGNFAHGEWVEATA